jgi:hypothetical protein
VTPICDPNRRASAPGAGSSGGNAWHCASCGAPQVATLGKPVDDGQRRNADESKFHLGVHVSTSPLARMSWHLVASYHGPAARFERAGDLGDCADLIFGSAKRGHTGPAILRNRP